MTFEHPSQTKADSLLRKVHDMNWEIRRLVQAAPSFLLIVAIMYGVELVLGRGGLEPVGPVGSVILWQVDVGLLR